ncbi:MAG: XdhC family protein, partial [Gemmatimonadetes bacterium]|nr:XdhC family protein [Gemmatimonadota bacterium]
MSLPSLDAIATDIEEHRPVALATVVTGPGRMGAHLVIRPEGRSGT